MKKNLIVLFIIGLSMTFGVKLGFNYPETGPYSLEGADQLRGAQLAVEEINAAGGILGEPAELLKTDSKSDAKISYRNAMDLVNQGAKMLFGGSSSGVAVSVGGVAQKQGVPFFGTLTYSNATTGESGHRFTFRECYNAWMGAKVLANYLKKNLSGKKYFYITADYTWGWTTEESIRKFSGTTDKTKNKTYLTPFPKATEVDYKKALEAAKAENPDVLVFVEFGKDMSTMVKMAYDMGLKSKMQFVVPNLTLWMAEEATPEAMEGVVGAICWEWKVPYQYNFPKGKAFVEKFAKKYNTYPSTSAASAYAIVYEFKRGAEAAKSFDGKAIVKALEGSSYQYVKDQQTWRDFDHQSIQTVYAVKGNSPDVVKKDKFKLDYFTIIDKMDGNTAAKTRSEWNEERTKANQPTELEAL
ncbi:MAG: ABC transporter substrate-binding protein [Candidatus Margulisbacteria bacterium]|nr:ABC transporter substrate-binding protein [Candidatus Margulisiibacteriota bacterium]